MTAYYNDVEPYVCRWLENLSTAGRIEPGKVDCRSVKEIQPHELEGYSQAHFFAGIGAWSLALRLAGWPENDEVWTGSCPCQPFGHRGNNIPSGTNDPRHVWPDWFKLIRECHPPVIFGEQVANSFALEWFDAVADDLEGEGYAVAAVDLCATSIGAPHIRQRLFWVAESRMGYTGRERLSAFQPQELSRERRWSEGRGSERPSGTLWSFAEWRKCRDGKYRAVEPGICPVAYGVPGRVGQIRAYGNSLVPALAAVFIQAYMEVRSVV